MLYCIWKQDYDDCGVGLVEGPGGMDLESMRGEFVRQWNANYEKYVKPQDLRPYDLSDFRDSVIAGFADWLCAEKGFKEVKVKFERWA